MLSIDKIAYTSRILKINPNEKLLFSILTMLICLFLNNIYVSILVLLLMYISIVFIAKIKSSIYFKLMFIPLIFLLIGVLTIVVTKVTAVDNTLFKFMLFSEEYGVKMSGVHEATKLMLKSLACVSCLYFLILTTPVIDILYSMEIMKLPRLMIEIIGLVYRYIFVLLDVLQTIYTSQNSRLGYSSIKKSFNSMGKLISSLFLIAYKQADESFISMESRCYTGEIKFLNNTYIKSKKNIYIILFIELCLIALYFLTK